MAFETFEITHGIEDDFKPSLPPLHTLNLPFLSSRSNYDNLRYSQSKSQRKTTDYIHSRRMSTSSSCTSPSESSSPSRTTSPSPSPSLSPTKIRLEPCTLDKADAVILFPPPPTTEGGSKSVTLNELNITRRKISESKPLFLVGPALHHFRHPMSRPLAKGARVHPYKIVRNSCKRHNQNDDGLRQPSSNVPFTGLTQVRVPLRDLGL